jgi:ribosomal protein L12E/L44/L45/RPP1/RPP2
MLRAGQRTTSAKKKPRSTPRKPKPFGRPHIALANLQGNASEKRQARVRRDLKAFWNQKWLQELLRNLAAEHGVTLPAAAGPAPSRPPGESESTDDSSSEEEEESDEDEPQSLSDILPGNVRHDEATIWRWPAPSIYRSLRVLDLCCATQSVGKACNALLLPDIKGKHPNRRGLLYVTLDIDARWKPTVVGDVQNWYELLKEKNPAYVEPGFWDIVFCSPPCSMFSPARTTTKRKRGAVDKKHARRLVRACLDCITTTKPTVWFLENAYNSLRHSRMMKPYTSRLSVASMCHYGRPYRQHKVFWTNLRGLKLKKCTKATPCSWMLHRFTQHNNSAQDGPDIHGRMNGTRSEQTYKIPQPLMRILIGCAMCVVAARKKRHRKQDA